jgi:peptidoglycan-N-acetylglucosamine deacetylase
MRWYGPAQPTKVTGTSTHRVDTYGRKVGTWVTAGQTSNWCPGTIAGTPAILVTHGPRTGNLVGLTFDMGGGLTRARDLVEWLIANSVAATIFPTGSIGTGTAEGRALLQLFAAHRDLIDVGNHSWDHPDFSKLDATQIARQLNRTEAAVPPLVGSSTKPLFRPPYGISPPAVRAAVGAAGWTLDITWDTVTTDYVAPSQGGPTADQIVQQVLSKVQPGSIVIMHVDGVNTLHALPAIVAGLQQKGLVPARMQDLLALDL